MYINEGYAVMKVTILLVISIIENDLNFTSIIVVVIEIKMQIIPCDAFLFVDVCQINA